MKNLKAIFVTAAVILVIAALLIPNLFTQGERVIMFGLATLTFLSINYKKFI